MADAATASLGPAEHDLSAWSSTRAEPRYRLCDQAPGLLDNCPQGAEGSLEPLRRPKPNCSLAPDWARKCEPSRPGPQAYCALIRLNVH
jgi:hypothetical protein